MTKDTQAKPSTGALRAADILWREYVIGTPQADGGILFPGTHRLAKIIDRETGMVELLRAAKKLHGQYEWAVKRYRQIEVEDWERLEQAIAKCESGTGRDGSYYDTIPQDGSSE